MQNLSDEIEENEYDNKPIAYLQAKYNILFGFEF
jgi:hypothetical protein